MRIWSVTVNFTPLEFDQYIEDLLDIFSEVQPVTFFHQTRAASSLIQIDFELRRNTKDKKHKPYKSNKWTTYSGWMRDHQTGQIYSAINDDALLINPTIEPTEGEFSYASLGEDVIDIATDHYTTHPVYYHIGRGNKWVVSSDLRILLAARCVPIDISRQACRDFLSPVVMVDENELSDGATFFIGVSKLPPNSVLSITADGRRYRKSTRPLAEYPDHLPSSMRLDDCIEMFRTTLNQCVQDRQGAGAKGLMLSGGIDSTTVLGACLAVNGDHPPFSLSVSFKNSELAMSQDELLLKELFKKLDLPHRILHVDDFLRLPTPDEISPHIDGPDVSANPIARRACAEILQNCNVSMVMTGEGGDVVLGEFMHELFFDSLRMSEGIGAVHQYINQNLKIPKFSGDYFRILSRTIPSIAHRRMEFSLLIEKLALRPPEYLAASGKSTMKNIIAAAKNFLQSQNQRRFCGHKHIENMLFPRASYFDALNVHCLHSHPLLDNRMIAFALACPPHMHLDYRALDSANPYASSKLLARRAYTDQLPKFVSEKSHKTSYAQMARQMFRNSTPDLYRMASRKMLLHEWGLIDQESFKRHLMSYIVATEDPNANFGVQYHFIRGVVDLESWLARFSGPRTHVQNQIKIQALCPRQ